MGSYSLKENPDADWDDSENYEEEFPEEIPEHLQKIHKENQEALELFQDSLKNLSRKTISQHMNNVSFFLEDYLMYYNEVGYQEGIINISDYLGYFYIRKCMWSTPSNLKTTAASIKKFYKLMYEEKRIEKEVYQDLLETIKDCLPMWQEDCRKWNNPDIEYGDLYEWF